MNQRAPPLPLLGGGASRVNILPPGKTRTFTTFGVYNLRVSIGESRVFSRFHGLPKAKLYGHSMSDDETRIADLENEIKHRDRRILESKREVDEAQALIAELREHAQDAN